MGLITGLLTLPLAPVRGTAWIAERVPSRPSASSPTRAPSGARSTELDVARAAGEIDEEEAAEPRRSSSKPMLAARNGDERPWPKTTTSARRRSAATAAAASRSRS